MQVSTQCNTVGEWGEIMSNIICDCNFVSPRALYFVRLNKQKNRSKPTERMKHDGFWLNILLTLFTKNFEKFGKKC